MTAKEIVKPHRDYIIEQYNLGRSADSISKELGTYSTAITDLLRENGVRVRSRGGAREIPREVIDECEAEFLAGKSIYKAAVDHGISVDHLWGLLKARGHDTSRGCKLRDDPLKNHADAIVARYESGVGIYTIAKEYNSSEIGIQQILKKRGVTIRGMDKYDVDESFFGKIDTEAKAYFLGIMYADGSVDDKGYFRIALIDEEHIYKLKNLIKYEGPIRYVEPRTAKAPEGNKKEYINCKAQYLLCVGRRKMFDDLVDKGCGLNKTFTAEFPTEQQVPRRLCRHFIRGVFDGDGSVFKSGSRPQWNISFMGTEHLLTGISDIIKEKCYINCPPHKCYENCKNIRRIRFGGNYQVERFLDWLYKDSTIHLDRKYERYLELKEQLKSK